MSLEKNATGEKNIIKPNDKEKLYTLQSFVNKINKSEVNSFGNYFVDLGEMFPDHSDCQG